MNKNTIKFIVIAIVIGIIIGKYVFDQTKDEAKSVINNTDNYIYLMQYGVYNDIDNMKSSVENLNNYLYIKEDDGHHVYVGITKNEKNLSKIGDFLGVTENIYNKRVKVNNMEFLESLDQYDALIEQTDDKEVVINAEKQILSKYEELVLQNE